MADGRLCFNRPPDGSEGVRGLTDSRPPLRVNTGPAVNSSSVVNATLNVNALQSVDATRDQTRRPLRECGQDKAIVTTTPGSWLLNSATHSFAAPCYAYEPGNDGVSFGAARSAVTYI